MKLRLLSFSVMLALVLTACETTRTNAPTNIYQCKTVRQCEATING